MPQIVELPGGQRLEFPDGMSQADMAAAIDQHFYKDRESRIAGYTKAFERQALQAEQAELRERDEGSTRAKLLGIAENIARPFSNPPRAIEELIEGAAVETGIAEPGSKLLISPDREIGRAVNRLGELASGVVEDTAALMSGEPGTYGGNIKAAAMGQPRPVQEAIKDVEGIPKFLADVSTTISHITPQIVMQRGLVKGGMAEAPAAGIAFGFTPEGFDAKTSLVMAAFPGVSQVGKDMALKSVGERVASDTARAGIGLIGSYVAAQTYIDLSTLPEYARMTPEEARKAWTHNFGVNLAFGLAHVPGMTKSALNEIKASREFEQALSESALEIAATQTLPSNAQRVVERPPTTGARRGGIIQRIESSKETEPDARAEQAQAEVSRVAAAEGRRTAKEIKDELIARLEEAQNAAPPQAEIGPTTPIAKYPPVKIHIPGDGDFTIPNTKEAIGEVLKSAKRITTAANPPVGKVGPRAATDRQSILERDVEDATTVYGDVRTAYERLRSQLERADELAVEAGQKERLTRLVAELEYRAAQNERALPRAADITDSPLKARGAAVEYHVNQDIIVSGRYPNGKKATTAEIAALKERQEQVIRNYEEALGEAEGQTFESRIERPARSRDVFDMDDAELGRLFEQHFGSQQRSASLLSAGRAGTFTFPTFEAFRDWMNTRYGERDLEGMRLAFAEASTADKVRYIKENKAADAHKRDWIAHLATGAPLPKDNPPITRTSPRPMPGGGTQPVTPPPARPAEPPPPPREPSKHRKFDVMALTQLFRQFSRFPVVNDRLTRAYGRFVPGTKAVELKERLLWDTQLAERVLGHEIGHFIDLIVLVSGKGKDFARRLKPLFDFRGQMFHGQELRNEARNLSRQWRGNFANGDRYRDSAAELFADFMSAMFNRPEWVNQNYPKLYDAFQQLRDAKPQFKTAYREIETWLQGDTMVDEWMGQQKQAVHRTLDELVKPKASSQASFMDRLKFGTLSLWQRAYEKEGKPRQLGTSITDELEYNKTWAAKENALFADDFTRRVEPELAKVSPDPLEGRTALLSYSQAVRTIGERRAAGRWIEQHPDESRQMLRRILHLDDTLRSKFASQLERATDAELYDLAAAMFREVHDRGEKFVDRIAREIDELDLGLEGEAALLAFNVRGKLLNPGGLTPENAQKALDRLADALRPQRFTALETAARNLRDLLHDVQSNMHAEGLISDKTWRELIEPNRDNYLPYAVLDYWEGRVRAGVMPQKGTAKDIADIAVSTQLKITASNVWRQQQRQVQLLRDAYAKGGVDIPVGEQLRRSRDIDTIRAKHPNDDVSRAVLWVDGKPHLVEFPGDRGKLLEAAMAQPAFYEHISWIAEASDATHRVMQLYTQFSVPFLLWRNPIRGMRTAGLKVGLTRVVQQMLPAELAHNLRLARNYADAAFGEPMLPEVRELVDQQVLLPPRLSQAMVRDSANLRQLVANHTILANQVRGIHPAHFGWWKGGELGRKGVEVSEKVFTGYEAFEKIYNYRAALEKGLSEAQATAIGRRAGIPKPGVGGKWSLAMEVWFPWTRVHIQGVRATYDMLRDPALRKGFAARFVLTEALPRVAKVAIGNGLVAGAISWLMRKDEDKTDSVMAEVMRRVSPYKMALDDIVPLMLYDARKGEYHYFWNYQRGSDIPKHFEVVSLRLPASEEGRLWGVLLYNMMISTPGGKEALGRPGQGVVGNTGQWAVNYLAPGVSPIIETTDNLKDMILIGRNPIDPYRGQPAANPRLFDAGGVDRAQAVAGYTLNQLGSAGELAGVIAANFGLLDDRALNALNQRLATDKRPWDERVPFLRTAVAHDNYAQYRGEKTAALEEEKLRAKARLLISNETRALYDFYYRNIDRKEKLTDVEREQFDIAQDFVKNIWGTLTVDGHPNPDSFYSKAAHAVSKDGSRMAQETVRRDLDAAAAGHIANFLELNRR